MIRIKIDAHINKVLTTKPPSHTPEIDNKFFMRFEANFLLYV